MNKTIKYVLYDILRNRIVIAYAVFLFLVSFGLLSFEENSSKAFMSLLNITLIVVPLISIVFGTIHFYNSYEFIELLLSQPFSRTSIFISQYLGVSVSLSTAFIVGMGIPIILYSPDRTGLTLIITGLLLTISFVSLSFLSSVLARDKAMGIGIALLLWFLFSLIYDGLILMLILSLSEYPVEKLTLVLVSLNPIDLGRIFVMLQMDISAMMGYTGAVYKDFFGGSGGMLYTFLIMFLWIFLPFILANRIFNRKDL